VFNLGNGNGFSVRDVIAAAEGVTGGKIRCQESDRRPGDPPLLIGSSDKIRRNLKWNPIYNSLETIIESTWRWQEKNT